MINKQMLAIFYDPAIAFREQISFGWRGQIGTLFIRDIEKISKIKMIEFLMIR